MSVDLDRQETAPVRRRNIIRALSQNFTGGSESPVARVRDALAEGTPRTLIVNSDVDGVTSAMMLASVSNWRIGALVDKTGYRAAQGVVLPSQPTDSTPPIFGIDVYSPLFPNVSNHPILFGPKPGGNARIRDLLNPFDEAMLEAAKRNGSINPSAWARIGAMGSTDSPTGMAYKYPLGTAQVLLAVLESVGSAPKFFDRQYLPWLVANCDGGLDTIRTYSWNAEMWWSALAAVVGPASLSEHLYRIATSQRPGEFRDVDRHLRYEDPQRSQVLNTKWNLIDDEPATLKTFTGMLMDWTGWPDPFIGGRESMEGWSRVFPSRGVLGVGGLTNKTDEEISTHLDAAKRSIHMGFSSFDAKIRLGWSLATKEQDPPSARGADETDDSED